MQGTCAFSEAKEENNGERGETVEHRQEVSKAVIQRLPRYYRNICELKAEGAQRISSRALAERMGLTASQIRQDFNCFGGFGQQGYGYNIEKLQEELGAILGLRAGRTAILLGAGNLGRALLNNFNFSASGFELLCAFDASPERARHSRPVELHGRGSASGGTRCSGRECTSVGQPYDAVPACRHGGGERGLRP